MLREPDGLIRQHRNPRRQLRRSRLLKTQHHSRKLSRNHSSKRRPKSPNYTVRRWSRNRILVRRACQLAKRLRKLRARPRSQEANMPETAATSVWGNGKTARAWGRLKSPLIRKAWTLG